MKNNGFLNDIKDLHNASKYIAAFLNTINEKIIPIEYKSYSMDMYNFLNCEDSCKIVVDRLKYDFNTITHEDVNNISKIETDINELGKDFGGITATAHTYLNGTIHLDFKLNPKYKTTKLFEG